MIIPLTAALVAATHRKPAARTDSILPVLDATKPVNVAVTVPATYTCAVGVNNLDQLSGTIDYIWYETTSGSPVEVASRRGQASWTSNATATPGVRKFYCVVTHVEAGLAQSSAQSRETTITISGA